VLKPILFILHPSAFILSSMRPLPVSLATEADLPALLRLVTECVARMRADGIEQWDEIYPADADLRRDLDANTLWVLRDAAQLVGCLTLDTHLDPLWTSLAWQPTTGTVAAVHRLMIAPSHQGRGLARRFMQFAEAQACRQGHSAIRLDSFVHNPAATALYERLGYRKTGIATMRKGPFAGFEKSLSLSTDGWPRPTPREFTGRYFTLRPADLERDMEELFVLSHASPAALDIWRYLPWGPFTDAGELREHYRQWQAKPDVFAFTVWQNSTRRPVGSISLMNIRPEHGVAELGFIWYGPSAQRTKANTESNYLLLHHCFEDLQYRRIEWKCDAANERSHRAALRLGYRYEGTFRQHMVIKGRNRDTAWLSILDHEWPKLRPKLEQALYQTNSDRW
jgi:RimJ/RimL family protein N-acetyltransferase